MNRSQARFVSALAALLLLSGIVYYLTVTVRDQRRNVRLQKEIGASVDPDADQRMQNFRRVQVRDGKKIWEVAARQARYFQDSGEVAVDAPEVSLYLNSGETIALRCGEGRLHLGANDTDVTRIELKRDLEIRIGDFSLRTQEAVYDSEHNTISSPGSVQISGPGLWIEGQGYTVDVTDKRLTLNAEVRTTVTREEG
jgi:LPS export ABC transporter protein LptC